MIKFKYFCKITIIVYYELRYFDMESKNIDKEKDEILFRGIQSGEEKAFDCLFLRYYPSFLCVLMPGSLSNMMMDKRLCRM